MITLRSKLPKRIKVEIMGIPVVLDSKTGRVLRVEGKRV